ncbi:glycogen debranching N-terminal domain-containing protein [Methanocella sp. MCL-LM]|uniref:amylo-alpha-1,6-glucosidase n=1 Tax=Methanocella sp. MCL-LM TaxID=3412035 RepID=UPI003C7564F9
MPNISQVHGSHTQARDILGALVIREKNLTLVTKHNGDIPWEENYGYGLYYNDCRFLSAYTLLINGQMPTEILSSDEKGYGSVTMLTNPSIRECSGRTVEKNTISLRRDRYIAGLISEILSIESFNDFPVEVEIRLLFDSDFDDIFTIRGITKTTEGTLLPPAYENGVLKLSYTGKDGHTRITRVSIDPQPDYVEAGTCVFNIPLEADSKQALHITISVEETPSGGDVEVVDIPTEKRLKGIKASYVETMECCSNVQTSNQIFNKVFQRSLSDLRMLYMLRGGNVYYSAGVPWYDALFGRDSMFSAMQVLPYNPNVSRSTLLLLASLQGNARCDWRDEEPGKILHELRVGEKANTGEIPQTPYYGSVDSTPLFLILLADYVDWTGDMSLFHQLGDNVDRAVAWLDSQTKQDSDGFLRYSMRSTFGLYNQGWKDSGDSVSHSDGSLAQHPIALAEVQGYVYSAKRRIAKLFDRLGRHDDAKRLQKEAANLLWKFNDKFWMQDRQFYAQALDSRGQCDVISSNPAQALWAEIVDRRRADCVVKRLFEPDMYTGWGIRTLSSDEKRYNPLGYHNGTIWPHDNSIIAMGLGLYDKKDELTELFTSMYEAAGFYTSYRLPELFGGYHRGESDIPIKYPVACSPQAWSSGCIPYMLTASLGFIPDALNQRLKLVKPKLPKWLESVRINSLHVGNAACKLEFRRVGESTLVNVMEKRGQLEVEVVY